MNPYVTVVISTYNRASWLREAVDSVRAQSFTDYELIIADDGSSDNTPTVAEQMVAQMGVALRYLRLEHSGRPSVARNRALAAARGELVAFLDDDDVWPADKLERQVRHFENEPETGMVYGDVRFMKEDGTSSPSPAVLAEREKRSGMMLSDLIGDCFIYPSTVMARRALVLAVGCFNESLNIVEDYDLWLRLAAIAPVAFVPGAPVTLRRHAGNITQQRQEAVARNMVRVLDGVSGYARLNRGQRLLLRRRQARARTHLAQLCLQQGRAAEGRREALAALVLNPAQRAAWRTLLRSMSRSAHQ